MWIKRLYTIHSKGIDDTMTVINEMMELFNLLSNTTMNPSNLDKLSLMYDAIPKELQLKVNFSSRLNYKEFYEEIKDKHSITVFNKERKFYNKPNSQHYYNNNIKINNQEDPMDIDNFENYKKKSKEFSKKHDRPKHCVICDNNGHLAKDCYFNPVGTNRNNKRAKNSRNNKRR
ncbi:hypothetical protein PIROE2DRAFT_8393, partial [Piromyces sp. E2]